MNTEITVPTKFENAEIALRDFLTDVDNIDKELPAVERIIQCNEIIEGVVRKFQNCMEYPLPCAHQRGDNVTLHFGTAGSIVGATIKAVRFCPSPIYDVDVLLMTDDAGKKHYTRILGISANCVKSVGKNN